MIAAGQQQITAEEAAIVRAWLGGAMLTEIAKARKVEHADVARVIVAAPKDAGQFIAASLARPSQFLIDTAGNRLAHQLLDAGRGPDWGASPAVQKLVDQAGQARADLLALGLLLCAHEAWANRMHWRHVHEETARYLRYLEAQGYQLSEVERRACGDKAAQPNEGTDG